MSRQGNPKLGDNPRFADILNDVKPLHSNHSNKAESYTPKPEPIPKQTLKNQQRALKESSEVSFKFENLQPGDSLSFCRPGIQKSTFRRLKKGQYSVGAELDLHGMTVAEAQLSLSRFIQDSRQENIRCVRIIHGKGYGSSGKGSVLKSMANQWLRQEESGVSAFCSARPSDGGTGAVYVLLKSSS